MSDPQTIANLEHATLRAYANEIALDAKHHEDFKDPVKFRFGTWWKDLYISLIGADILTGDEGNPRRNERGFFGIRHNDSYPKEDTAHEFVVNLTLPNQEGDEAQKLVFRLTHDSLELFGRKVNLGTGSSGAITRFYTDGGKFAVNWQDDTGQPSGIVYETHGSTDESTWTAVGRVRIDPL